MKTWMKIVIAVIGTGLQGGLTYSASIYTAWAQVFCYIVLAIGGAMTIIIGWPANKTEA